MATTTRCPTCNKFGSSKLGGYCKDHYPHRHQEDPLPLNREFIYPKPFYSEEPFFPSTFRCLDKKNFNKEPSL